MKHWPRTLLVQREVRESALARRIVARWKHGPIEEIDDPQPIIDRVNQSADPLTAGKKYLLLAKFKGRFVKPCQALTQHALCCNYYVINFAQNCNLECTYCILQAYLNNPLLVQFTNIEDLLDEIRLLLRTYPGKSFRFGTGELTDSLTLDPLTGIAVQLAEAFREFPNTALEFKTKTDHVDNLLRIDPPPNVIVSWSLNALELARREELKTATFEQRLDAARRAQQAGYQIALHFDPLIHHAGWRENYRDMLNRVFDAVDARQRLAWVSLGSFRFPRGMKETLRLRFPNSRIAAGELVNGFDGKLRYFIPLRVAMYSQMVEWLRAIDPGMTIYLCMESREVWRQVFGGAPADENELAGRLEHSCGCSTGHTARCGAAAGV